MEKMFQIYREIFTTMALAKMLSNFTAVELLSWGSLISLVQCIYPLVNKKAFVSYTETCCNPLWNF